MIGWLRRMFRGTPDAARIVPQNPEHAHQLDRADALLANPKIRALESRGKAMRGSFVRADRRLAGR